MVKKTLVFLLFTLTIGIIVYVVIVSRKQEVIKSPLLEKDNAVVVTPVTVADSKYEDEAGFNFLHPQNAVINKVITNDETVYSSLEISSKNHTGKIFILVMDTQLVKIDDYFDKTATVKKLKLGSIEAGQIEENNQLITVAIDQGALFVITADYKQSKAFWLTVNNKIISSFTFALPKTTEESVSQDSGYSGSEIIDEGEEEIN
jgi:hypothetical protein